MSLAVFVNHLIATFKVVFISWAILILLEILFPLEKQSLKSYLRGARNTVVIIPITTLISVSLISIAPLLSIQPFILHVPDLFKPIAPLITWFLGDVCYYWMHRFQHTKYWWRFHRPHHELKELNIINSASHWMESFTGFFFQTIPLMFIQIPGEGLPFLSFLFIWGFFIHSNTRLNFGVFRYLFADGRYHRVHHSVNENHWGKNYAAFFPIIDIVFGTAYFPKKKERLKTKKRGEMEPKLTEFLT